MATNNFDPTKYGAKPFSSASAFDPFKYGATSVGNTPDSSSPIRPSQTLDQKLSNMPGVVGFLGSGVYNAAKGIGMLAGSAALDTFHAINHPIDATKSLYHFTADELGGGAKPETLDTLGNFVQSTVGSKGILGAVQLPAKAVNTLFSYKHKLATNKTLEPLQQQELNLRKQANNPRTDPILREKLLKAADTYKESIATIQNATDEANPELSYGNIAGTTLNAGLTALTFATGNIGGNLAEGLVSKGLISKSVGQTLKNAATSFVGRSLQTSGILGGFQVGSNLQEGLPVTTGLKQALGAGLALPGVIKTTGAVLNKITPNFVQEAPGKGAEILRKTIGFRGGNTAEKAQFDKSVPVVYDELKKSGFQPTDIHDPNNLINLDKAVTDSMDQILNERTARLEKTGVDTTINGELAAAKIRSLIEPGSVEDLTNPGAIDRLDTIAKNFEGKRYTPLEAQQAIIEANKPFSFSENPSMASQIKRAISQAFTPELDRIVGGAKEISYDTNGKPIPVEGGTAELNKRWSAYRTVKYQLDKKLILEDRKAPIDLGTRIVAPNAVSTFLEGAKHPYKMAVGGLELLANKYLGDRNNVNYRIYRAFNGNPIGETMVGMLNKFSKMGDLLKFLGQNPLIANLLDKINKTDSVLHSEENLIPNRNGGFIKVPGLGSELSMEAEAAISNLKKLTSADFAKGGKLNLDLMAQAEDLIKKYESKDFTKDDLRAANEIDYQLKRDRINTTTKPSITIRDKTLTLDQMHTEEGTKFFETLSPTEQEAFAKFDREQSRISENLKDKGTVPQTVDISKMSFSQHYPTIGKSYPLSESEFSTIAKENPKLVEMVKAGTAEPIPVRLNEKGLYEPEGDGATRLIIYRHLGIKDIPIEIK